MTQEQAKQMLVDAAEKLGEHFHAVQIHASWMYEQADGVRNGQTSSEHGGCGDWYARKALCQEFIEDDQADTLARRVAKAMREEEE